VIVSLRKNHYRRFLNPNNGLVAQMVEQWIENPCVGGSIPPEATSNLTNNGVCHIIEYGTLTQFGRVLVFETNGRGFKSLMSLQ